MSGRVEWLEKQQGVWSRGFERVFNEVIEDVDKQLKKQSEEHQNDLKNRADQQQILSNRYNEEIIKNAHLVEDNSRLKRRLERLDQGKTPAPTRTAASGEGPDDTGATVPSNEYQHLAEKFNDLHKKHQEVIQRLKYAERKNVAVMQKNREMKETVLAWQKYSDRQEAKRERLKSEAKPSIEVTEAVALADGDKPPAMPSSPASSAIKTPRSVAALDRSSPAPLSLLAHVQNASDMEVVDDPVAGVTGNVAEGNVHREEEDEAMQSHALDEGAITSEQHPPTQQRTAEDEILRELVKNHSDPYNFEEKISSSQTTEDDLLARNSSEVIQHAEAIEDDDMPQFVSERSLKRKRPSGARFEIYADPVQSGSSISRPFQIKAEPLSSPPAPNTTHHLVRKETLDLDELGPHPVSTPQRRIRRQYAATTGVLRHQRSISVPVVKEENPDQTPAGAFVAQDSHIRDLLANETRAYSEPFEYLGDVAGPLRPLDPNMQPPLRPDEHLPNKRQTKHDIREVSKYEMMAESGDTLPADENNVRLTPNAARAKFNRRLKDGPIVQTTPKAVTITPVPPARRRNAEQMPTPPTSNSKPIPTPSTRGVPRKPSLAEMKSRTKEHNAWPATRTSNTSPKTETPLRSKPATDLKLSDFKPNPAYNQGYSYAFSEVVRKRSDRACLPGCTRTECCGSTFRTLATTLPPLSLSAEESLLEDYLGDAYDSMKLSQMDADERKELVLQARTREMANKHGRHRQAYERQKSPPGYWRIDFPSTQEIEEDRTKARDLERLQVQERRAEALRKGGKWIFRDG